MTLLLQLIANGVVNGALFAMLAVAFGLIYRSARIFHVAFGGLYVVSAYLLYAAAVWAALPLWTAICLSVAGSAIAGIGVELGFYRWFVRRRTGHGAVLVASLGLFIVIENLVAVLFGNEVRSIPRDLAKVIHIGPVLLTSIQLTQLAIGAAALASIALAMRHVRALKAIWAMGDDSELLALLGNPLGRYRVIVFALATALAAIPACMIGVDTGIEPHMGMHYLLVAAVAMLLGGRDRFGGWVAGGFLLALLHSVLVWKLSAQWMDLLTFVVLIAILTLRPQGLFGVRRRLEEHA